MCSFRDPCCFGKIMLTVTLMMLLIMLSGCGGGVPHPVQPDVARKTLSQMLESWKKGETPDSLQQAATKIVVQDMDWTAGQSLVSYEILGDDQAVGANLVTKVKLRLRDKEGQSSEKTVTYHVGTSPVLTVFRDIFN